jgi:hypothetical protein
MNASAKFWLSFGASRFVNSNILHLNCNNINLNFIWYCMLICVYLRILTSSRISWYDLGSQTPHFYVVLLQLVSKQDWDETHTKASKNHNNIFSEKHLAHIRTIVVNLCGKLIYVLFYTTTKLHQQKYVMIFGVFILFYYWWPYFIVWYLCRTIRACGCLLLLFMDIFGYLCLDVRTLSRYFGTGPL